MFADLHLHSTCSDGTLDPLALAEHCASLGIEAISVADHDAWRQNEILAAGDPPLIWIPGVELSTACAANGLGFHVLGYGLTPDDAFQQMLQRLNSARQIRIREYQVALARIGIRIDAEAIIERSTSPGKPEVVRSALAFAPNSEQLRAAGATDIGSFIELYLNEGCPAHVPKQKVETAAAIVAIRRCGGHPVWAHPALDLRDVPDPGDRLNELRRTLDELVEAGLEGLETDNFCHTPRETEGLRREVERLGLRSTAGSDFHDFEDKDTGRILTHCDQDITWLRE